VWDDAGSSQQLDSHMPTNDDPRIRVWYDASLSLHDVMAQYVDEPAPLIDQYFIFAPGSSWSDHPGQPANEEEYGHEGFDDDAFLEEMRELAPECDEVESG
jgi:hypothetical protein